MYDTGSHRDAFTLTRTVVYYYLLLHFDYNMIITYTIVLG
jgi:hypothetical protein